MRQRSCLDSYCRSKFLQPSYFFFLMWETRLARREALHAIAGRGTILAMFLLLVISMLIGWFIGGPDDESRRVLATSTGMRSVVVVLYAARYCFPGTNVYMIPIVYLSLMVPTNLLFHLAFVGCANCGLRRRGHRLHQNRPMAENRRSRAPGNLSKRLIRARPANDAPKWGGGIKS